MDIAFVKRKRTENRALMTWQKVSTIDNSSIQGEEILTMAPVVSETSMRGVADAPAAADMVMEEVQQRFQVIHVLRTIYRRKRCGGKK